jgi:hypothetical protein
MNLINNNIIKKKLNELEWNISALHYLINSNSII